MKEILRFNKPKTRPIQIEPWFFRYLNGGELKVVAAIIAHADIKNRQDNSFPSNRRIVVLAGFDIIKPDSKKYDEYEKATFEEKILIKKNRIKTGIQQVKNIKKKLEEKGLLKREIVGKPGKQKVYLILDYKWKREEYEREFREFETGEILEKDNNDNEMINNELEEIKKLIEEGSVSKDSLAQRLNNLSHKIKSKDSKFTDEIPIEDIEKVADYYMNTTKIKNRVEKGDIVNEAAFRQSIIKGIKEGTFTKVDEYYKALEKKEQKDTLETLTAAYEFNVNSFPYKGHILIFKKIRFEDGAYIAKYQNDKKTFVKEIIVPHKYIKTQLPSPYTFTRQNRILLETYITSIEKLVIKYKKDIDKPIKDERFESG